MCCENGWNTGLWNCNKFEIDHHKYVQSRGELLLRNWIRTAMHGDTDTRKPDIRKMMMDRHKNDPKIDYWDAKRYTLDSNRLALTSLNAGCLSGRLCSLIVLGAVERWSLLRKGNIIAWSYGNLDM